MIVRELITKLGFKVDDSGSAAFEKRIGGLRAKAAQAGAAIKQAGKTIAVMGAAAAGAAVGVVKLVESVAAVGDQAAKDAKKLGLTAEALQELGHAAELSGSNMGTVKVGMQALARGLNDAKTKGIGPAAEALEQLGISLNDPAIQGDDLSAVMDVLADKFEDMPDGAQKTALAMKLFSRSGAELIPLLNEGSDGIGRMRQEARDLGIVMSNDQAAASEQFIDDLTRAKSVIKGLYQTIGVELMPVVQEYLNEFHEWIMANRQMLAQRVRQFLEQVVRAGEFGGYSVELAFSGAGDREQARRPAFDLSHAKQDQLTQVARGCDSDADKLQALQLQAL